MIFTLSIAAKKPFWYHSCYAFTDPGKNYYETIQEKEEIFVRHWDILPGILCSSQSCQFP
jgi:hypothetical protein